MSESAVACSKKNDLAGLGWLLEESQESPRTNSKTRSSPWTSFARPRKFLLATSAPVSAEEVSAAPPFIWLKLIKKISLASALKSLANHLWQDL
jgi:hypothetical protein